MAETCPFDQLNDPRWCDVNQPCPVCGVLGGIEYIDDIEAKCVSRRDKRLTKALEAMEPDMSQSFDQWLDEIEVFSTRRERAFDDLGPDYEKWLLAAWIGGMECVDPAEPLAVFSEKQREGDLCDK